MAEITSVDDLKASIEGKSDDEINAGVAAMGTDGVLDQIFAVMASRFNPGRAAGQSAVIGWDIKTADGVRKYQITVADGTCTAGPAGDEPARVTLTMALPDFLKFLTGQLDGMQAFMTGKLQLAGDMMFAQSMQAWFSS
jgi:putative sterol carrier protein